MARLVFFVLLLCGLSLAGIPSVVAQPTKCHPAGLAEVFAQWNRGDLASYLVEIAGGIFRVREADGVPLVDRIVDRAGQKGTGRWTSESGLQLGVPLTLITESVGARHLSALLDERRNAASILPGPPARPGVDRATLEAAVHHALLASKRQAHDPMDSAVGTLAKRRWSIANTCMRSGRWNANTASAPT